ncbi:MULTISPECIES: beta-propeller fold lactonase family protein [unclassified Burkholderia]|uniref:lactonase family protein n=1 Tax=unclassified Burkholderia TaxID=2613784 RepID=UPI00141F4377|nr:MULTISPECIES: beta-propeller fold lactonase family protein [unclassified Burkholderia]NIE86111.1 lactonase family protein [Burkholderia sp. Tr-860]NIF62529.1 lactonase family protein [Burkholderia sp. Cy-647]NIF96851.1 lactonase family protein [Burkholderia sp. Ax-1720]
MSTALSPTHLVTVSNAEDGDLSVYHLDAAQARLAPIARTPAGSVVMPQAPTHDGRQLYVATRGTQPTIVGYDIGADGTLTQRFSTSIDASLAYLSVDRAGRLLFGASYGGSRLFVWDAKRVESGDGAPLQFIDRIQNAHSIIVSEDDRYVYAASLGSDRVLFYGIARAGEEAALIARGELATPAGFGPRHLRLAPDGATLYVIGEFHGTVLAIPRDPVTGELGEPVESDLAPSIAHLAHGAPRPPAPTSPVIWAADLQVSPDGRFVFATERTANRLITFRVDENRKLHYASCIETEPQPRGIRLSPDGSLLAASGELSTSISLYRVDAATGALTPATRIECGKGANWIEILPLRGA